MERDIRRGAGGTRGASTGKYTLRTTVLLTVLYASTYRKTYVYVALYGLFSPLRYLFAYSIWYSACTTVVLMCLHDRCSQLLADSHFLSHENVIHYCIETYHRVHVRI
jgi:hypothetical protein